MQITSLLEANQAYGGTVSVSLEAAPADRDSNTGWTTMETRIVESGNLTDLSELLIWNYTVPNTGQWDLRLVIDPSNAVDERDEGNNNHHMVVTGASISGIGTVPSFAPSIIAVLICGLAIAWWQKRKVTPPPS